MTAFLNPATPYPATADHGSLGEWNPFLKPIIEDPSEAYRAMELRSPAGPLYTETPNKLATWLSKKPMYLLWPETGGYVNLGSYAPGVKATATTLPAISGNQVTIVNSASALSTGLLTRRNLKQVPYFAGNLGGMSTLNGSTVALSTDFAQYGTQSLKVITAGSASNTEGAQQGTLRAVITEAHTYTVTAWMRGTDGVSKQKVGFIWRKSTAEASEIIGGGVYSVAATPATNGWTAFTVTAVAPAGAAQVEIRPVNNGASTATTYYVGSILLEESGVSGSFFPTPAQLASGEAGWTGAEQTSNSDIGPFAHGTGRTFVVAANPTAITNPNGWLGQDVSNAGVYSSGATAKVVTRINGVDYALSAEAKVAAGANHLYATTFNDPTNIAAAFIDGVKQNETATASEQWAFRSTPLTVGITLGSTAPGKIGPVAVYPRALTAAEVAELT